MYIYITYTRTYRIECGHAHINTAGFDSDIRDANQINQISWMENTTQSCNHRPKSIASHQTNCYVGCSLLPLSDGLVYRWYKASISHCWGVAGRRIQMYTLYIWLRVYAIEMLCTIVKLHIRKETSYSESVCAWLCIQYNDNTYHIFIKIN